MLQWFICERIHSTSSFTVAVEENVHGIFNFGLVLNEGYLKTYISLHIRHIPVDSPQWSD